MKYVAHLMVVGLVLSLVACKEDDKAAETKTYTIPQVVDAWHRGGKDDPVVLEVKKACQADIDAGKGVNTDVCRIDYLAQSQIGKEKMLEKLQHQK